MGSILHKLYKGFRKPALFGEYLLGKAVARLLPDRIFLLLLYRIKMGKPLPLDNPITYNQKLQWLKLYDHNPKYVDLVDKFAVREYVKDTIGEQYLVPLFGVYNTVMEIDFSALPDQFVMKPTHTSGDVLICTDKLSLSTSTVREIASRWLQKRYYWGVREWPYKNIAPRIVCEKLLIDESGFELKDYKVFCFNGIPKFIQVDFSRFSSHKRNFYSLDWKLLDFENGYPSDHSVHIEKPVCLEEVITLAKQLSKNMPHVRVDFYICGSQIYFGELTFYHGSGYKKFTPESYDTLFGGYIDLSPIKEN
nr:ATP-grasp fold amidoligase family protein [uncultured Sphaerochaeta sp.]